MGHKKKEVQEVKEVIPMEITPNCAKCKWFVSIRHALYLWNKTIYTACTAQARKHPPSVYNSECCKKLYETK